MYKKIDIRIGPKLIEARLLERSICPCGYPVVPDVPLGKTYKADLNSVRWARFRCGGCGQTVELRLIDVWDTNVLAINWFFLGLLDIDAGLPLMPKPEHWQPVYKNLVAPRQGGPGIERPV